LNLGFIESQRYPSQKLKKDIVSKTVIVNILYHFGFQKREQNQ